MKSFILFLCFNLVCAPSLAADLFEGDLHKKDSKWLQFNIYESRNNKLPFGKQNDTFFEMEFGGRSGIVELYGFIDVFDALDTSHSDYHNGDNFFLKIAPRFSLDSMLGANLEIGLFKEWYIATLALVADRALFQEYIGIGTNIDIPWLGKVGANLMARYVRENYGAANESSWDGVLLATNWFKPFYSFGENYFLTYQGYLEYTFAAHKIADGVDRSNSALEWYNGFYWHSLRYSVGYGLKAYKDMALFKSGGVAGETTGLGHYLVLTYKF